MTYSPPLRDLHFALEHVADAGRLHDCFAGYDAETETAVLEGVDGRESRVAVRSAGHPPKHWYPLSNA